MTTVTRLYLKSFFVYGIIFALLMTLWEYIDEEKINIWKQIFQGAIFGGLMSWTTIRSHKQAIRKQGKKEMTEEDFKVSQSGFVNSEKSIQQIYVLLNNNDITSKWKLKIENSKIIAKTKISWSSWGEKIIISDLENIVKIESEPVLKTTMFDNGRNRENVLLIKSLIENN
ncbi:MAG: hypothetical protein R6U04_07075 [Bacteroidales bacterium]